MKPKRKQSAHTGMWRAQASCRIACNALDGKMESPPGVTASEYALYNIARALEDISKGLEELIVKGREG